METEIQNLNLPTDAAGPGYYAPTSADRARIRRYVEAEELLDVSRHEQLFKRRGSEKWTPLDLFGMLARLARHYTFGHEFRVRADKNQTEIDAILKRSGSASLFQESAEAGSMFGDVVWRVDKLEAGATIRGVRPHYYFPTFDPRDSRRLLAVTFAWVFPVETIAEPSARPNGVPWVVLRETLTPGKRTYQLNAWDGAHVGAEVKLDALFPDLEAEEQTGVDEVPVVHVALGRKLGKSWGEGEFHRVRAIVGGLENRLAQEDEALDKHAKPKLIVGPGILDERGKANLKDFDVIEVDPSIMEKAVKPEYLTWDMQITGIQHQIEKLEEYFFITTETSPASFGLERDGSQVESARALMFKAHRTVNKVHDARVAFQEAIEAALRIAQKLEGLEPADLTFVWPSPIIEDETQEVTDYSALRTAKLVSRKRAVMDLFDLTPEEADAEVQEILQDMVDEADASEPKSITPPGEVSAAEADLLGPESGQNPPREAPSAKPSPPPKA